MTKKRNNIIMPKATAIWLIENSALSFQQIADFCNLNLVEIQAIADGEIYGDILPENPILNGQLTSEEIERSSKDPLRPLSLARDLHLELIEKEQKSKRKKSKYIPIAKRRDKPNAISWLLENVENIGDDHIIKLVGTTKDTITKIRTQTHKDYDEITPRDPAILGLCKKSDIEDIRNDIERKSKKDK